MNSGKKIFIDADAFVALNLEHDSNHEKALIVNQLVVKKGFLLITSDPAFGEAITVISQKSELEQAILFAESILSSDIEIIDVDLVLRMQALDIFKKQTSKNSRFTDCINMAIMKEKDLSTIFSFDEQYKKNKFKRFGIDE